MMLIKTRQLNSELLQKYSLSIPRYTSYPTTLEWTSNFTKENFLNANAAGNLFCTPVSLYFHLPFCESHCYFCACNVVISKKNEIVAPYLEHLIKEIQLQSKLIDKERVVEQIHFGGGTPTYFSPGELRILFKEIKSNFNFSKNCEISIEIDPRVTTYEHMETLVSLGFNRISMGIQDFDFRVQEAVNRVQPYEETRELVWYAREFGFQSINVDLIYGLPFQTKYTFASTIDLVLDLDPERIALFHYAHLPELLPHQAKYIPQESLPNSETKIDIFRYAVDVLTNSGYEFIGLDHFAKPQDELELARKEKTLHRNFQGYTTKAGSDLYGFGITAISNVQNTYVQNHKKLKTYYEKIDASEIPIFRGIVLNNDDILRKEIIMRILCHGVVPIPEIESKYNLDFKNYFALELNKLKELENDALVSVYSSKIEVTEIGRYFLRNIASVFDYYLNGKDEKHRIYSKTV